MSALLLPPAPAGLETPANDAAVRLAAAEALIACQQQALREAEVLVSIAEDAAAELAAAHSPTVRRLTHAAERTRRCLALRSLTAA